MAYRGFQGFRLTPVLMLIIVNLMFLIGTFVAPELIYIFGLQPATLAARPWTVITSIFIHGGLWHFIANMITLYFFGNFLSRLVGDRKLLIVYFGGGLLGSALFILLAPPLWVAVGASGAVFALGGALVILRPNIRVFIFPIPVPIPLWIAVIGGFIVLSFATGIAWQAHLGGLIFGLVAGYFFKRRGRYAF